MLLTLAMALVLAQDKPQELKDNPLYKHWANCKPGSWVKTHVDVDAGNLKMQIDQTQKLIEVTADKVVIEVSGTTKTPKGEFPSPPQKQDINLREASTKMRIDKEGDEEIDVAGKKFKCHWYEVTLNPGDKEMKMKGWLTMEIPGGIARMEMTPTGQQAMVQKTLEWEKK